MIKKRFRLIDDSNIGDHPHLEKGDQCFFLHEYTSGQKYSYSSTNSLISNLKKPLGGKNINPNALRYKERAIQECSEKIAQDLDPALLIKTTLVPVPPSKAKDHPGYDDRMLRICKGISVPFPTNVRELVFQSQTIPAAHQSDEGKRPLVSLITSNYRIDESITAPEPSSIGIVDDVLTTGGHFKAMQQVLQNRFPGCHLFGIFIARRVFSE